MKTYSLATGDYQLALDNLFAAYPDRPFSFITHLEADQTVLTFGDDADGQAFENSAGVPVSERANPVPSASNAADDDTP